MTGSRSPTGQCARTPPLFDHEQRLTTPAGSEWPKAHQVAGAVAVQAQQGLQNGDQRTPLPALGASAIGKGRGRDDGEPAGDLAAAHTGEQALSFDIDAGINERGWQSFVIFSLVDAGSLTCTDAPWPVSSTHASAGSDDRLRFLDRRVAELTDDGGCAQFAEGDRKCLA